MKYRIFQANKTYSFKGKEYIVSQISSWGSGLLYMCQIYRFTPKHDQTLPDITAMRWPDGEIERFKYVPSPVTAQKNTSERHNYMNEDEQYRDLATGFGFKPEYYENMRIA